MKLKIGQPVYFVYLDVDNPAIIASEVIDTSPGRTTLEPTRFLFGDKETHPTGHFVVYGDEEWARIVKTLDKAKALVEKALRTELKSIEKNTNAELKRAQTEYDYNVKAIEKDHDFNARAVQRKLTRLMK